jgi:hypothetical protein
MITGSARGSSLGAGVTGVVVGSGSRSGGGRCPGSEKSRISAGPTTPLLSGCACQAQAGAWTAALAIKAAPTLMSFSLKPGSSLFCP